MLIPYIILILSAIAGTMLTYLFVERETLLWRLAAGNIVGSVLFGAICFVFSTIVGFSLISILIALAISLAPLLLQKNRGVKTRLTDEWQRAKDNTQGFTWSRVWRLLYYVFFLVLFIAFFDRAIIIGDGIYTGAAHNLGDLPLHLGAIFSFTEGADFPPQNPSFAGSRFTYTFAADFLAACLVKLGAGFQSAILVQNVTWALSLLVILERFVFAITKNRLAGKLAPILLFFSGGVGFMWFVGDYFGGSKDFWELIWNLPRDYTMGENLRWGNSLIVLFITQRSILLGMPLTIIVLNYLWNILSVVPKESSSKSAPKTSESPFPSLLVGLLAGCLPLIHAHSLFVLFVVSAFFFFLSINKWKSWFAFAAGASLTAIPQIIWMLGDANARTGEFFAFHFGWHAQGENLVLFWLANTGIFFPLLLAGIVAVYFSRRNAEEGDKSLPSARLFQFYLPFLFLFIISNVFKFAPWEWDNIKILIYWFVGSLPFVSLVLAWTFEKGRLLRSLALVWLFVLVFSGTLDIWRTVSGQIRTPVFEKESVDIAERIKKFAKPDAVFLNAPTYNSAVVLSGRPSFMRYPGHLSSHGIDYRERERDLRTIYRGGVESKMLINKYGIAYVLFSPRERDYFSRIKQPIDESIFDQYSVVSELGEYKIVDVR